MSSRLSRFACLALVTALLGGCKMELYSNLPEDEANRMLALLMLRHIGAEKQTTKGDTATILVDKSQFVDAVELLRQNGLPSRHLATIQDLFPSGQLVTSPAQEQAKITFLKEQELQRMLSSMDGVVEAQVAIAETPATGRYDPPVPSAAVFVKYSPARNLEADEAQIRALIVKGVPGLEPRNVTVVMQRTDYRYLGLAQTAAAQPAASSAASSPASSTALSAAPPSVPSSASSSSARSSASSSAHAAGESKQPWSARLWLGLPLLALGLMLAGVALVLRGRRRQS